MLSIENRLRDWIPQKYQVDIRMARELWGGEGEIRLLPALLSRGGAFIDVGANLGAYCAYACYFTKSVEVFEPHPELARRLRSTLAGRVSVHEVALSDQAGSVSFHIPLSQDREIHSRGSIEECHAVDFARMRDVEVARRRLDDFVFDDVALIKIDVEGHEPAVLRGGVETLRRHRPSVIVEVEDFRMPGSFEEVRGLLGGLGYEGFYLLRGQVESIVGFDVAQHQSAALRQSYGEKRDPDFVNNFIFQPRDARWPLEAGMSVTLRGPRRATRH